MSAMASPFDLTRAVDEAADLEQGNCTGCGAHLRSEMTVCEYCRRQTPYGARRARLARLAQNNVASTHWAQYGGLPTQQHPLDAPLSQRNPWRRDWQ